MLNHANYVLSREIKYKNLVMNYPISLKDGFTDIIYTWNVSIIVLYENINNKK